jgi:hypothetical protein
MLGRHFRVFQDKLELGVSEDQIARLERGRARNARLRSEARNDALAGTSRSSTKRSN